MHTKDFDTLMIDARFGCRKAQRKKIFFKVWFPLYHHDLNDPLFLASYASPQLMRHAFSKNKSYFIANRGVGVVYNCLVVC